MPADDPDRPAQAPRRPGEQQAAPEFGPRGYLPERAAKRARKIVMREQMGPQWVIAALVAAIVVLAAGTWWVLFGEQPPDEPFVPLVDIAVVDPRGAQVVPAGQAHGHRPAAADLAIVRAGGSVRVFRVPTDEVVWCEASGRLESSGGAVWNTNGRLVGGPGRSLEAVPSQVFDGVLYVHATADAVGLPSDPRGEQPACAGETP